MTIPITKAGAGMSLQLQTCAILFSALPCGVISGIVRLYFTCILPASHRIVGHPVVLIPIPIPIANAIGIGIGIRTTNISQKKSNFFRKRKLKCEENAQRWSKKYRNCPSLPRLHITTCTLAGCAKNVEKSTCSPRILGYGPLPFPPG